jgi:hypothetical protein
MAGTSANTYAIGTSATAFTNLNEDSNNFVNTGTTAAFSVTGGLIGAGGTNSTSLAAWRTATGKGAGSKNVPVFFVSDADCHLTSSSNGDVNLIASPIAGITTDIDGNTRSTMYPYMGADEASVPLPVHLVIFTASAKAGDVLVTWSTASEVNNKGFDLERSVDGKTFEKVVFIGGRGNSSRPANYNYTDKRAFAVSGSKVLYYRLRQVDLDGQEAVSHTEIVTDEVKMVKEVSAFPNPFLNNINIQLHLVSLEKGEARLCINDVTGKNVANLNIAVQEGSNLVDINNVSDLKAGIYILQLVMNGEINVIKIVKE